MVPPDLTRRQVLKGIAALGALGVLPRMSAARPTPAGRTRILAYLRRHARPDGGYAFDGQQRSHLTPTFAVIAAHRLLGAELPEKESLIAFVRTHHPRELKKLEQERRIFEFQQVQALRWLGDDATDFRDKIGAIIKPQEYKRQYERHGYPIFQSELGLVQCHALLGLPLEALQPAFGDYLRSRRRANGSYNNTPASDGGDGHVMNTYWGLQASVLLGGAAELRGETAAWIKACQRKGGGFTYQPNPEFSGIEDAAYTRAAVRSLQMLDSAPTARESCVQWLLSLANSDGGFSDRPGWRSNPLATYYVLDALDALGALNRIERMPRPAALRPARLPGNLKVFSIQLEAHGTGSPAEAVALAGALKIDLWGSKNAKPGWIERAQQIAALHKTPVQFFTANEEYGTWLAVPGLGTYSHTSDLFAPFGRDIGHSLAGPTAVSWPDFRARRLAPLQRGDGRLFWQFGENEELVRILLDDSVARGGFAAISTFHFGNPDFTNTEPFLHRWRGRIPFVGMQDAHGAEPWWWADMTEGYRTLFLATEPTWQGWLEALKRDWVVAVRHDEVSRGETWMHGGADEVLDFVRSRESDWRWWDNPRVRRPLASLVTLRPEDTFEAGHPKAGVVLRLRCAWKNTPQGFPRERMSDLVALRVDDREVQPELVEIPRPKGGGLADCYFLLPLSESARQADATVREVSSGRTETISCPL
ncbi:MAG: terpene cyclase/mutase family protein [Opitutaceae bacterium]|nr:terpene cyclase/mutase family protein [Opitutaceae bacterium]